MFSPNDTLEEAQYEKRTPIYEMPVQAAICEPLDGTSIHKDEVAFKGYAYSGGGKGIARVELTTDNGETWQEANLTHDNPKYNQNWSWTLWDLKIPKDDIKEEVCVKAVDSAGNSQPKDASQILNFRGLLNNAWHCIRLNNK